MIASTHYYIWYRITGDPAKARAAVNALMHDVARYAAVTGRLLVQRDEPSTWMEIYENVIDPTLFDTILAEATSRCGIGDCMADGRHVERFADAP